MDVQILQMVQSLGEGFYPLMKAIAKIGDSNTYFLIIVFLVWFVDYRKYALLMVLLPFCSLVTGVMKYLVQMPRPYHTGDGAGTIDGYGMPSGHTMSAVAFWGYLSSLLRRRWFTILAVIFILGVNVSRVYSNSHFPSQVAAGTLIGIVILWVFMRHEERMKHHLQMDSLAAVWLASSVLPLLLVGLTAGVWIVRNDGWGLEDLTSVCSNAGLLAGFWIGTALAFRRGRLISAVPLNRQAFKLLLTAVSFLLMGVLNQASSAGMEANLILGGAASIALNFIGALWFSYAAPLVMTKIGLMRLEPA